MKDKPKELPESYFLGQEYVEDQRRTSIRFDVEFYSPAELQPFDFYYKKRRIIGSQKGRYLNVSFVEKLPRKLIEDIAWNKGSSQRYVYGYLFSPIHRVNQEILRQRYALGHFLASTFSFFDIVSIKLTNIDETPTDEIISVPWPPVFSPPPHSDLTGSIEITHPEVFIRDYIDAWNDFFKGDYDNCVRRLITSVENFFSFHSFYTKKSYPWWNIVARFKGRRMTFREVLFDLKSKSKFIGHEVVADNLLFLYKVRNRITHGSLRIRQDNGWWICGKGLETVQYLYQFLDGGGTESRGAYIFHTYGFANFLFHQTRGSTVEEDEERIKFTKDDSIDREKYMIRNEKDMNEWKFGSLRFSKEEQNLILANKSRG